MAHPRAHETSCPRAPSRSAEAWIEDGLAPVERVIVYPSDSVADGKRVKVVRGPA